MRVWARRLGVARGGSTKSDEDRSCASAVGSAKGERWPGGRARASANGERMVSVSVEAGMVRACGEGYGGGVRWIRRGGACVSGA